MRGLAQHLLGPLAAATLALAAGASFGQVQVSGPNSPAMAGAPTPPSGALADPASTVGNQGATSSLEGYVNDSNALKSAGHASASTSEPFNLMGLSVANAGSIEINSSDDWLANSMSALQNPADEFGFASGTNQCTTQTVQQQQTSQYNYTCERGQQIAVSEVNCKRQYVAEFDDDYIYQCQAGQVVTQETQTCSENRIDVAPQVESGSCTSAQGNCPSGCPTTNQGCADYETTTSTTTGTCTTNCPSGCDTWDAGCAQYVNGACNSWETTTTTSTGTCTTNCPSGCGTWDAGCAQYVNGACNSWQTTTSTSTGTCTTNCPSGCGTWDAGCAQYVNGACNSWQTTTSTSTGTCTNNCPSGCGTWEAGCAQWVSTGCNAWATETSTSSGQCNDVEGCPGGSCSFDYIGCYWVQQTSTSTYGYSCSVAGEFNTCEPPGGCYEVSSWQSWGPQGPVTNYEYTCTNTSTAWVCAGAWYNYTCSTSTQVCTGYGQACAQSVYGYECQSQSTSCNGYNQVCAQSVYGYECTSSTTSCTGHEQLCAQTVYGYECQSSTTTCTGHEQLCAQTIYGYECTTSTTQCVSQAYGYTCYTPGYSYWEDHCDGQYASCVKDGQSTAGAVRTNSYSCTATQPVDTCQAVSGCQLQHQTCGQVVGGACQYYIKEYRCEDQVQGAPSSPGTVTDQVGGHWNPESCPPASSSACALASTTCTGASGTRIVNGYAATAACWEETDTYQCEAPGNPQANNCSPPSTSCEVVGEECLDDDGAPLAGCQSIDVTYLCSKTETVPMAKQQCNAQICLGDICMSQQDEGDDDGSDVLAATLAMKLAGQDYAANASIFKGKVMRCHKAVLGFNNCCKDSGWGPDLGLANCSADEKQLMDWQEAKYCHYVGTHCSKKALFGACLEKKMTYCCFEGMIGRIVQEAGRPQVAKSWGSSKSPDCSGFTVEQFEQLDLSEVDFSEFANDVMAKFANPDPNSTIGRIMGAASLMTAIGTPGPGEVPEGQVTDEGEF